MRFQQDASDKLSQLKSGRVTADQLVRGCLSMLERHNPAHNGAVKIFKEEAVREAAKPKTEPLLGLPISMKECFAMQGEKVTLGSMRMPEIKTDYDAAVIKKLKDTGVIIIARTNTSEFLLSRETDNLRFGRTNNPLNPQLTSGGSSGGEGALVASGCSYFGIGSDIGGSIRVPGSFCGLVGFKPSSEAIDKTGFLASFGDHFAETMNAAGPITRSVRDARLVYNIIAKKGLEEKISINGARLIIPSKFRLKIADASIDKALAETETVLVGKGMKKESMEIPEAGDIYLHFLTIIIDAALPLIYKLSRTKDGQEFSIIGEFFRRVFGKPTMSKDMLMTMAGSKFIKPSASKVRKTISEVEQLREKYHRALGSDGILVLPTMGILALPHGKVSRYNSLPGVVGELTPITFCNVLNLPAITLPAWKFLRDNQSSPPAVMLVSAKGSENLLLSVAEELEKNI